MRDWIRRNITGYSDEERKRIMLELIAKFERLKNEAPDNVPPAIATEIIRQMDEQIDKVKQTATDMGLDLPKD